MNRKLLNTQTLLCILIIIIVASFYDKIFSFITILILGVGGAAVIALHAVHLLAVAISELTFDQFLAAAIIGINAIAIVAALIYSSVRDKKEEYIRNNQELLKNQLEIAKYVIEDGEQEYSRLPGDYQWIKNSVKRGYGTQNIIAAVTVVINQNDYRLEKDPIKLQEAWRIIKIIETGYSELRRLSKLGYQPANIALALKYIDSDLKTNKYIKEAVKQNDRASILALADYYYYGEHCKKSWSRAKKYYLKAIECPIKEPNHRDVIKPYENLMTIYHIGGYGVRKNEKIAFSYALKATAPLPSFPFGLPTANYNAGLMFLQGLGVPKDQNKALEYFKKSVVMPFHNTLAHYYIATISSTKIIAEEDKIATLRWAYQALNEQCSPDQLTEIQTIINNIEKKLTIDSICDVKFSVVESILGYENTWHIVTDLLSYSAENRHAKSQFWLGEYQLSGNAEPFIAKDITEGINNLKMAAAKGSHGAQTFLASIYAEGIHTDRDLPKAYQYFRTAIDNGHAYAMRIYGFYLISGDIFQSDVCEGLSLIKDASAAGDVKAKYCLAVILYHGLIVDRSERDLSTAINLLSEATIAGYQAAASLLGYCYWWGIGCEQSYKLAFDMFSKADGNDRLANAYLGNAYSLGRGVEKNKRQAFIHTVNAADQDHMSAQYSAAHMFKYGEGVYKSEKFYITYLNYAAEQGVIDAQIELASLYLSGEAVGKNIVNSLAWTLVAAKLGRSAEFERVKLTSDLLDQSGIEKANEIANNQFDLIDLKRNGDWHPVNSLVFKESKISRDAFDRIIYST